MKKEIPHNFRLKALDKAKSILKSHTISPFFFAELMLACPESSSTIMKYSSADGMDFHIAKRLLSDIAGIVITKGYDNTPDKNNIKARSPYEDEQDDAWDWYDKIKQAGKEYVSDINNRTQMVGMIPYGK